MAYEFRFPDVGSGITEGEIVKWLVREGDTVKEDQILVEIETDKAVVEVPSPKSGTIILRHKSSEGQKINVGDIIVVIGGTQDEASSSGPSRRKSTWEGEKYVPGKAAPSAAPQKADAGAVVGFLPGSMSEVEAGVFALPAVRKLARELGVNLASIKGSGPGGRVTEQDVRKAGGQAAPAQPATVSPQPAQPEMKSDSEIKVTKKYDFWGMVRREPLKGIRKATAEKMALAASKAAIVTNMDEADVTDLAAVREKEKKAAEKKGVKLTFMPFIVKAVVESLKKPEHSIINSSLDEAAQEIVIKDYYNIGFAAATDAGLVVPVIKGANAKSIMTLAKELGDLAEKAKSRKLDMADMMGGTFTITNLGAIGGSFFTPIPNHPEAAILGVGRMVEKPGVKDGNIAVRKMLPLSLSYDHRLIDGAQAAAFLNTVISYLEDPDLLLVEE